jgi:proline iminopeptidase
MTPDEHTNQEFFLDVGDGQRIYVQDWGKAEAKIPIIYLHGGPGDGCSDRNKQLFNPSEQRVIFHDQRGAGKSTPSGELTNNTTQHLIEDIEKLAAHLGIEQCVIVGGSWGSTLALAYGIAHAERVAGMVIDGVFTGTREEVNWSDGGGWRDFFPEVWEKYQNTVPEAYKGKPSEYHCKKGLGNDPEAAKKSAYHYANMSLAILKLDDSYQPKPYDEFDPASSLIAMHYLSHDCFLPDKYILKNARRLTMPVYLIQGRYDMVCRPRIAYELSQALPNGKLTWTINGHTKQHEAKNILTLLLDNLTGQNNG